ncbi:class I SAM-dependent methyltransferase [Bacillus sp. BHET2]|uniref:class I SAM-dependent methyltransferase n=1 Tax=Bacillus sp. BHET2 TaxID=2583818 RepID=UPI00110D892B|nr:class I SAM-dependent methyltransferase [Bacillus sp. BHET2]TMU87586.1 class I SAM-dependent methyltransferase [Bacillus sp. BHET2]
MKQNIYDHPTFFKEYMNLRESGLTYNDFLEQPAMKAELPNLNGKKVLDLGCGIGGLSTYCIQNGCISVDAVDISSNMINIAKNKNAHQQIEYICTPIEEFERPKGSYDLIVSSLAIHYIEDFAALMEKLSLFLKHNGLFIFSIEHPIVTARKEMRNWFKDGKGDKLYWALDHYQEEGKREQQWYVDGVIKYHRTISTLVNTITTTGFMVEKMIEPLPTQEGLELMPKLKNEKRRPSFLIIKASKIK